MAVVTIPTLKSYFQTGDFPTESQFVDLIDTLNAAPAADTLASVLGMGRDVDATGTIRTSGSVLALDINNRNLVGLGGVAVRVDWASGILGDNWVISGNFTPEANNTRTSGSSSTAWSATHTYKVNSPSNMIFEIATVEKMRLTTGGDLGIGVTPTARLHLVGSGATSATYSLKIENSALTDLWFVRDDGKLEAGSSVGALSMGNTIGFDATLPNLFIGVNVASGLTDGTNCVALGNTAMRDLTSADYCTAVGVGSSALLTTGQYNASFGYQSLQGNLVGARNAALGANSLQGCKGNFNTAVGMDCLAALSTADNTTAIGFMAGTATTTNGGGVFIGNQAGYYETVANKLFIDNTTRTNEADGRVKALVYGGFAATTASQWFTLNANVGILTSTFGTSADAVLGIANGTVPSTSPANMIQIFSADTDDATTSLGLRAEQTVASEAVTSDRTLKFTYNGTIYKILLKS